MEEAIHYKQGTYLGNTVFITVQVKETRKSTNQSLVLLGMYIENGGGVSLAPQGSSILGLEAYNGGAAQSFSFSTPQTEKGITWLARDLEALVSHAPDGTADAVPLYWRWSTAPAGVFAVGAEGCFTAALPPLDLATSVSIYTTDYHSVGKNMVLSADPCQRGFTHDLSYDVLGTTGEIVRGISGKYVWTIPEELLLVLTSRFYVCVNLICTTYNGDICLGTKTTPFYLSPGDVGRPQVQEDWCRFLPASDDPVVDSWGIYVEGYSYARVILDEDKVTFAPGAALEKRELYLNNTRCQEYEATPVLRNSVCQDVKLALLDSRGYGVAYTEKITPYPYSPPVFAGASCFRSDQEGNALDAGSFLQVSYTPVYSEADGHNEAVTELKLYSAAGALLFAQVLEGPGIYGGSLSARASYRAELTITDSLDNSSSLTFIIPAQTVAFQIMEGGEGAAFGGISTQTDCLDIHWSRLRLGGQEVTDIPVEQGHDGNWYYRKWKSGLAECWGSFTGSLALTEAQGGLHTGELGAQALPLFFTEAPVVQASLWAGGAWLGLKTDSTQTHGPACRVLSTEAGSINYRLMLTCTGRWKE